MKTLKIAWLNSNEKILLCNLIFAFNTNKCYNVHIFLMCEGNYENAVESRVFDSGWETGRSS